MQPYGILSFVCLHFVLFSEKGGEGETAGFRSLNCLGAPVSQSSGEVVAKCRLLAPNHSRVRSESQGRGPGMCIFSEIPPNHFWDPLQ